MKKPVKVLIAVVVSALLLASLFTLSACKCECDHENKSCTCNHENANAKCEHEYENGKCTHCGAWVITEGVEYALTEDGDSYGVIGYKSRAAAEVYILPEYNGKPVTTIFNSAFTNSNIVSVHIPDSVTTIEDGYSNADGECLGAFGNCERLQSVVMGNGVTSIGISAFYGCDNLIYNEYDNALYLGNKDNPRVVLISVNKDITSFEINEKTKVIYEKAFFGCNSLTSITIPDSVTSIGWGAFARCSSLTSITIPDSVTSIGESEFSECSSLTSITIPNSVTSIGWGAFARCSSLTSITIPDSVTSIGDYAFYGCSGLKSITIPNSVTSIEESAFSGCSALTSVTIGNGVTSIGESTFRGCSSLTNITIPNSVTSIGESAFRGCSSLTNITIPDSVTSIGYFAFDDCSGLKYNEYDNALYLGNKDNPYVVLIKAKNRDITSCEINEKTKFIYDGAFFGDIKLTSIIVPDSVTTIGLSAFSNCSGLTSVTIPNSVTRIGQYAFSGCSNLTEVNYKGTEEQWNKIAIGNNNDYLLKAKRNYI